MAKRRAVGFLMAERGFSERRACRIVDLARSVQQYRPLPKGDEAAIKRMKELASENRRKLPRRDRVAPQVPERPMQRWSLDFVSDQLADYRRFRVLNVVDDHSRFCPGQIVDVSIPGARVARFLMIWPFASASRKRSFSTTGPKTPAKPCSTGQSGQVCGCGSSSRASRCRTASWRVSTASSGMSA